MEKLKEILVWLQHLGAALLHMFDEGTESRMEGEKVLQYLKEKLKEILVWLQHLGAALLHTLDEILAPQIKNATLRDWIIWVAVALAVGLMVTLFVRCCYRCCCCCCRRRRRRGFKMMKAPGRNLRIPRSPFETNPTAYFRNLRSKAPLDPQFGAYQSLV